MPPFSLRQWIKRCFAALNRSRIESSRKRGRARERLNLEQLEDRITPSAVSWTGNAGTLNWGDANKLPTRVGRWVKQNFRSFRLRGEVTSEKNQTKSDNTVWRERRIIGASRRSERDTRTARKYYNFDR